MSSRLISSGIVRSRLLRPASTCATGTSSFAATRLQARVEFTSPTTTTILGARSCTSGSNAIMIRAVCRACVSEPTSRSRSGAGRPSSVKKIRDISSS